MTTILRLIRFPNLIIIALTMILIRYGIELSILKVVYHMQLVLPLYHFILLVVSVMMIAAAGYIINDYFDVEVDAINRPDKQVIGKSMKPATAHAIYYGMNAVALLITLYLCWRNDILSLFFIFPVTIGILWFYSTTYKRQLLIGNFIISIVTGVVPLLVVMFDIPAIYKAYYHYFIQTGQNLNLLIVWVGAFSVFAFLLNLVREIVKDAEDFEGDITFGRNTLPVVTGMQFTKGVIVLLLSVIILLTGYVYSHYLAQVIVESEVNGVAVSHSYIDVITGMYLLVLLIIPFLSAMVIIIRAKTKKHYAMTSLILKLTMVTGICYAIVVFLKFL